MPDNLLPAGFLDESDFEDTIVASPSANPTEGNYNDFLDGMDDIKFDEPADPKNPPTPPPADPKNPPADPAAPPADPAAPPTDEDWDEKPAPIADWEKIAEANQIVATTEQEFRDAATVRNYVQTQFKANPEAMQLYQLADEKTPARTRLNYYLTNKLKEDFETADDPDVIERVRGAMTDYIDDEGNLTTQGKKADDHLKKRFDTLLNERAGKWQEEGQKVLDGEKAYVTELKGAIKAVPGLTPEQQRLVYSKNRNGYLERVVDGVDEQGKPLSAKDKAKLRADADVWADPETRKILLQQIAKDHEKKGESTLLKTLLA